MVYSLGCVCHLANLCAKAGIELIPLPVEDLLIDVYFHFHHSAKRKEEYKEFLDFTNTDPLKILKHCSTRWLSLKKCIGRLLQQWPALKSYFASHEECERGGRVQRCTERLSSQDMYLHYLFLDFILPVLDEFNTTFQAESALIGHQHGELMRLFRRFLGKFVKTSVITRYSDLMAVDYKSHTNQHEDSNLAVGLKTREYLQILQKCQRFLHCCCGENGKEIPPERPNIAVVSIPMPRFKRQDFIRSSYWSCPAI